MLACAAASSEPLFISSVYIVLIEYIHYTQIVAQRVIALLLQAQAARRRLLA